jgi:hypothetical protein
MLSCPISFSFEAIASLRIFQKGRRKNDMAELLASWSCSIIPVIEQLQR